MSYLQTRIRASRLYEAAFILAIAELTRRLHQACEQAYDKQAVDWVLPQNSAPNSDAHEFAHSRLPCPPTGQQLAKNPVVKKGLQQAFDLSKSGRIERGGWIYWNARTGKVFTIIKDPKIDPLNPRNSDTLFQIFLDSPPTPPKGTYIVGDFHTHLDAGPDDWDIANAFAEKVPGIVISPAGPEPYGPNRGIWRKDLPPGCH